MSHFDAYEHGRRAAAHNSPMRVFDWNTAARRIREVQPKLAEAGMMEDWSNTSGRIYEDGSPVPEQGANLDLSSSWATPVLRMDGLMEECWLYEPDAHGWDESTYWPESALAILRGVAS